MKDPADLARIEYVLRNFDNCEIVKDKGRQVYSKQFRDKNNRPAPEIKFSKQIDGTYYVIEAVTDSADKKLHIISAYMQKSAEAVLKC